MPQTLDLTPTWAAIMPAIIAVLQDGTPEGRALASDELLRLANLTDQRNAEDKAAPDDYRTRPKFEAIIWTTHASESHPVTVAVFESVANDVAAYAAAGHLPADTDMARLGMKLTERQARAYGAGWPSHLTYRR